MLPSTMLGLVTSDAGPNRIGLVLTLRAQDGFGV